LENFVKLARTFGFLIGQRVSSCHAFVGVKNGGMKKKTKPSPQGNDSLSRRSLFKGATAGIIGSGLAGCSGKFAISGNVGGSKSGEKRGVRKGRINQSVVSWCFKDHWSVHETCEQAVKLGCKSVELIETEHWPELKKHDLTCAIATIPVEGPPFIKGFNNPKYHDMLLEVTKKTIDDSADFGCPNVIAFTGYAEKFSLEEGAQNCVDGFKKVAGYAEKKGVTICLEMLNSRDDSDPNKGHPGYQGDHIDYCMDILNAVGSPRVKLLFDIYHVQIMDGDIIRRIRECGDMIGHVHTAGNPGRGELDDDQEINYPPIMEALLEIKYKGFVGQEFIPTRDPELGLAEAVELCDI
jgi:hydroxypyruvate isomerase